MNATISYKATVSAVSEISKRHKVPISSWINEGAQFKFVGDNVDKKKGVRNLRADSHGEMKHMFSMIAVKSRVSSNLTQPMLSTATLSLSLPIWFYHLLMMSAK